MFLLRIVLLGGALLAVVGQYLVELRRVARVKKLSGRAGRELCERARRRGDLILTAMTLAMSACAAAISAWVHLGS
jgi:hypothetical protein